MFGVWGAGVLGTATFVASLPLLHVGTWGCCPYQNGWLAPFYAPSSEPCSTNSCILWLSQLAIQQILKNCVVSLHEV